MAGPSVPGNIELHYTAKDFTSMFLNSELDAITGNSIRISGRQRAQRSPPGNIGNVQAELSDQKDLVQLLFPNPRQEAVRFYKKTELFPPNHCTVIRENILKENPWVAISLMVAFEEGKKLAIERLHQSPPSLMVFGEQYFDELKEIFGVDPYPYGIKPNAKTFDLAQTFSVQQGQTERKQTLEEIFPEEVLYHEERM